MDKYQDVHLRRAGHNHHDKIELKTSSAQLFSCSNSRGGMGTSAILKATFLRFLNSIG